MWRSVHASNTNWPTFLSLNAAIAEHKKQNSNKKYCSFASLCIAITTHMSRSRLFHYYTRYRVHYGHFQSIVFPQSNEWIVSIVVDGVHSFLFLPSVRLHSLCNALTFDVKRQLQKERRSAKLTCIAADKWTFNIFAIFVYSSVAVGDLPQAFRIHTKWYAKQIIRRTKYSVLHTCRWLDWRWRFNNNNNNMRACVCVFEL